MKILRPEEAEGLHLVMREFTPEELAEAYRLAREAFTAADLQAYTELDEGILAREVLGELEGNGQPARYEVHLSARTERHIKELRALAVAAHNGAEFATTLGQIMERLEAGPWSFGEPLYRLPAMEVHVRQVVLSSLVVDFAVHDRLPLVFLRGIKRAAVNLAGQDGAQPGGEVRPKTEGTIRIIRPEDSRGEPLLFRELTPEEPAEVYRLARESFTAADLQKYTELDEGVPAREVLAELEAAQKAIEEKPQ